MYCIHVHVGHLKDIHVYVDGCMKRGVRGNNKIVKKELIGGLAIVLITWLRKRAIKE